ncbi:TPA: GtrA family protein [Kluyvera ascorbata]|nr:GtrA family protein [Kluyvera ascorbata]
MVDGMYSLTFTKQAIRYALVGLANTAVTAIVIFSLMKMNIGLYTCNIIGYIAGIIFSFVVNSKFTFSSQLSAERFIKFLLACLACWLLNVAAIKLFLMNFPEEIYISQLIGMIVYTCAGFLINKLWVMK